MTEWGKKNSEKVCKHWWWTMFINISWNEWFGMCKCFKQIRYNEQRRTQIFSGKVRLTIKTLTTKFKWRRTQENSDRSKLTTKFRRKKRNVLAHIIFQHSFYNTFHNSTYLSACRIVKIMVINMYVTNLKCGSFFGPYFYD